MGTWSYFTFAESALDAFTLTERLNNEEATEYQSYGVHYVLKLNMPLPIAARGQTPSLVFQTGSVEQIQALYAIAWSGQTAACNAAGDHAKYTIELSHMLDDLGMAQEWRTNPKKFGTMIEREQLAAEAVIDLPSPEPASPSPEDLPHGPWFVEFGEHDGYDCMSAAYTVRSAFDQKVAVVDLRHYLTDDQMQTDMAHAEHPVARAVAEAIAKIGGGK